MNFDEFEKKIMNYPSRQEMISYLDELREAYAKPVEMNLMQSGLFMAGKNADNSFYDTVYEVEYEDSADDAMVWIEKKSLYSNLSEEDLMRAWLNIEVIKVVE